MPMLRRHPDASRGVIVHSHYVERDVRNAGFEGPVAVIPHGAWIPEADRLGYRHGSGLDLEYPAHRRVWISQAVQAHRRIAPRIQAPAARAAERPDDPGRRAASGFSVAVADRRPRACSPSVRVLGFTPIEDFVGYIAACDIILNLRFPTVGESSGTLLRSLGLGKA